MNEFAAPSATRGEASPSPGPARTSTEPPLTPGKERGSLATSQDALGARYLTLSPVSSNESTAAFSRSDSVRRQGIDGCLIGSL